MGGEQDARHRCREEGGAPSKLLVVLFTKKSQAVLDTVHVTLFVQSHVVPAILMAAVVRLACT